MNKISPFRLFVAILFFSAFCRTEEVFAQQFTAPKSDSTKVTAPDNNKESKNFRLREGILDADPPNLVR
ncbi:MAG TPA: hypothetical protein VGI43_01925, partial [Mucilaginibacter sp.]